MSLQKIFNDCGLTVDSFEFVTGGDISSAYRLSDGSRNYFLKVNDAASYPGMFAKEAGGLNALNENSSLVVPQMLKHGVSGQQQYLLMEHLERGAPAKNFWEDFGSALADMHQRKQSYFGWDEDNYIGSLPQTNTRHEYWNSFFADCRLMPLVKKLHSSGAFSSTDVSLAERLCAKLDHLFPQEPPALLHGDLWSGNYLITSSGKAAIFDPAVYCGHREMDIGMTLLFGGFEARFYDAYHEAYPLQAGWRDRVQLTQLYPLLVHAVLFGGHYVGSTRHILQKYAA
jgi:fructosamine-3-kinase